MTTATTGPDAATIPTCVDLTATQLAEAVRMIRPHLGSDDTLPMLTHYQLVVRRRALWLAATDRYSAAMARIVPDRLPRSDTAQAFPTGFAVPLPAHLAHLAVQIFKPTKGKDKRLEPEVRIRATDTQIIVESVPIGGIEGTRLVAPRPAQIGPPIVVLLQGALRTFASSAELIPRTAFNGHYLARFIAAERAINGSYPTSPLIFRQAAATKPLIVTCADRFVGALQPVRIVDQGERGGLPSETRWLSWLADDDADTPADATS